MSRNYQMHDLPREEAERFDAYDRLWEQREKEAREREAINREAERARLHREMQNTIDDISRPLSSCEIAGLRSKGFDV